MATKVLGWTYYRTDPRLPTSTPQTREVALVASVAEVMRLAGLSRRDYSHQGCRTQNPTEVELANRYPGVVLFQSINSRPTDPWYRLDTREQITP